MGHYVSEMRSDDEQREIDAKQRQIALNLKRKFRYWNDDAWACEQCGAIVDDTDLHWAWHERLKRATE